MTFLQRSGRTFSIFLTLLLLFGLPLARAQQSASVNPEPVGILLTATDKDKRFVTTLRKEDVRVTEDGTPREIVGFKQQMDQSVSVVIMLDTSLSQERVLPIAKQTAQSFISSIIHSGKDRIGVISFTSAVEMEQTLTSDINQARQAIERVEFKPPPGYMGRGMVVTDPTKLSKNQQVMGSTSIWDIIWSASEKSFDSPSVQTRRAIILITDGQDTSSKHKLNEAIERAIQSNVAVYSIGIGDDYFDGTDKSVLRKLSERTGGRSFFPKLVKDVKDAFDEIEQELRSQYLITFSRDIRNGNDKLRKIKVEVVNPELRKQGLQLSYQEGYFSK